MVYRILIWIGHTISFMKHLKLEAWHKESIFFQISDNLLKRQNNYRYQISTQQIQYTQKNKIQQSQN